MHQLSFEALIKQLVPKIFMVSTGMKSKVALVFTILRFLQVQERLDLDELEIPLEQWFLA